MDLSTSGPEHLTALDIKAISEDSDIQSMCREIDAVCRTRFAHRVRSLVNVFDRVFATGMKNLPRSPHIDIMNRTFMLRFHHIFVLLDNAVAKLLEGDRGLRAACPKLADVHAKFRALKGKCITPEMDVHHWKMFVHGSMCLLISLKKMSVV